MRFQLGDDTIHAVNRVSFHVDEGETLAIVGESGSGKSASVLSCLRLIPEPPGQITRGEVWFEGRDLLKLDDADLRMVRGKGIAIVFQDPHTSLTPVLTIGRQVSEAIELHLKMNRRRARDRSVEFLELVGIPDARRRLDDYPHQFSGGMRQRSMIATALSCNPRLLIADEPTTALDVTIQAQILDLVRRMKEAFGMAMIWITHDLGVVAGLADRVAVMYAGQIVEEGPVKQLFSSPQHPYTRGLLGSIPHPDQVKGERLTSIEGQPPDLLTLSKGCPFYKRCTYHKDKCLSDNPPLLDVGPNQQAACWVDPETRRLR